MQVRSNRWRQTLILEWPADLYNIQTKAFPANCQREQFPSTHTHTDHFVFEKFCNIRHAMRNRAFFARCETSFTAGKKQNKTKNFHPNCSAATRTRRNGRLNGHYETVGYTYFFYVYIRSGRVVHIGTTSPYWNSFLILFHRSWPTSRRWIWTIGFFFVFRNRKW